MLGRASSAPQPRARNHPSTSACVFPEISWIDEDDDRDSPFCPTSDSESFDQHHDIRLS